MKRIICFICVFIILVFNCVPCFALESFTIDNFQGSIKNYMVQDRIDYINNNLDSNLLAFILNRDFQTYLIIFKSTDLIDYNFNSDHNTITFINNSDKDVYVSASPVFFENSRIPANSSLDWYPAGYGPNFGDGGSIIYKGDCINNDFCSADVYVDMSANDDYAEDGVVIKGLTGFFNKISSAIDSLSESFKNFVSDLIGIPEDGYFSEKIDSVKSVINEKYNLDSLFGFFEDMKNIQSTEPNINYNENININNHSLPFNFSVNFSWFSGKVKDTLFLLMRAVCYPTLIIYNLNQFYLLFRGRKFFNSGGEDND